jgi:hypothetical protein
MGAGELEDGRSKSTAEQALVELPIGSLKLPDQRPFQLRAQTSHLLGIELGNRLGSGRLLSHILATRIGALKSRESKLHRWRAG